jgi:hypothetical protein
MVHALSCDIADADTDEGADKHARDQRGISAMTTGLAEQQQLRPARRGGPNQPA